MKFWGHSIRNIDSKGRLMLPPDFRDVIQDGDAPGQVMLTRFDACVYGYAQPDWDQIVDSFQHLNLARPDMRRFQRFFLGGAMQVPLDKQGRILVPPHLRKYAALDKEVVLAGSGRRFEIWNLERYEREMDDFDSSADQIMTELTESGYELRL
ncbi:division/cell wall cluster transcriptional repressor MraZ [Desulfovermiculus halophilus]|uniref:division/cell wall cluster transcriptional repressor MraZ n=1 Tax=Desulfovermiculus halophilus TaxID=339722 RepID=UPI00048221A8|nr:division/cell wall cluster transcriptional repressor MraZ [Desulfovermiculus halophilus]